MSGLHSTVLRLERQIQQENSRALAALHQQYEDLSQAILTAARSHGYLGNDPLGAIGELLRPPSTGIQLGESAAELWRTFFACFRPDEAAFEAVSFRTKAEALDSRLAALTGGQAPDLQLTADLLAALAELWHDRHEAINARIDQLIVELSRNQAQLGSAQLATAHSADEIKRAVDVVAVALAEAGDPVKAEEPLAVQIQRLLSRYRHDLLENRRRTQETVALLGSFIAAIHAVASDRDGPTLPGEAQLVVDEVRRLHHSRRELETTLREVRTQVASIEASRRELMEEVAARDRRLEALDRGDSAGEVDERLKLYRAAFAALEANGDWKTPLEKARSLERVISLTERELETARKIVDRQLTEIARGLEDLRKVNPLSEDPKRFRPRLFNMGARYDFKSLMGLVQATRDASRDLLVYAERMRWSLGVQVLARQAPKLRAVFKELVGLVADWREKMGDPPPVSLSVRMDGGSGILALPAIVAADLDTILRRKAKATLPASDIAPILEECVALYHKTLSEAKGGHLPRPEKPKRETYVQACARLALEMTQLAGSCETAFHEAAHRDFRLDESDTRLLGDEHLVRVVLTQLDAACGELAGLPNAAPETFKPAPSKRDLDRTLAAVRERVEYLELFSRYRIQPTAQREPR